MHVHYALNMGNMLSSENKILIKICVNLKGFLPEESWRNIVAKSEQIKIGRHSVKVVHNQFNQTHCKKPSAAVMPNCR